MMRYIGRNIGKITIMATALLLLPTSCSNDDGPTVSAPEREVSFILGCGNYVDVSTPYTTRALPDGFMPFDSLYSQLSASHTQIVAFFTTSENNEVVSSRFSYTPEGNAHRWSSRVHIDDGTYYIYGFLPGEDAQYADISPYNGNFANGAVMTIRGLSTVTPADVSVIVGVKGHTDKTTPITAPVLDMASRLGKFDYTTQPTDDYVYLLMDHIYAGLNFKAHIDPTYAKLRTIKVKRLELLSDAVTEYVDVSVTVVAGVDQVVSSVSFTYPTGATTTSALLFPRDGSTTEFEVPAGEPEEFVGCYAPNTCRSFVLKTTYDVYDKEGNLIRKDCEAENVINAAHFPNINTLKKGQISVIDLYIKPSYLYVLSDPDLDYPTISLSEE